MTGRWVHGVNNGMPYSKWVFDMPRVPQAYADGVVYLYRDEEAARQGESLGGCGAFVGVETDFVRGLHHIYVVTNAHISDNFRTVRYNTQAGPASMDLSGAKWFQAGDDLSICRTGVHWFYDERVSFIRSDVLMSRERMEQIPLRHGDELFMVSRFVGHPGNEDNEPVVRFGTLAKARPVPVVHKKLPSTERDFLQESFLAEMRSLPGHSGSPTFVYFTGAQARLGADEQPPAPAVYLLGIDWGHPLWYRPVLGADRETPVGNMWVADNSGMTCVVPAWKITELLESEAVVVERREWEHEINAQVAEQGGAAVNDAFDEPDSIERTADLMRGLLQVSPDEVRKQE